VHALASTCAGALVRAGWRVETGSSRPAYAVAHVPSRLPMRMTAGALARAQAGSGLEQPRLAARSSAGAGAARLAAHVSGPGAGAARGSGPRAGAPPLTAASARCTLAPRPHRATCWEPGRACTCAPHAHSVRPSLTTPTSQVPRWPAEQCGHPPHSFLRHPLPHSSPRGWRTSMFSLGGRSAAPV